MTRNGRYRHWGFALALLLLSPGLAAITARHADGHRRPARAAETAKAAGAEGMAAAPRRFQSRWQRRRWVRWLSALLREPAQRHASWGVAVYSLSRHRWVYRHNAERLFAPASNAKLFTLAAALHRLGPNLRLQTTVLSAAPLGKDGVLRGDLVLRGGGDATLSAEAFPYRYRKDNQLPPRRPDWAIQALADQLQARGLRRVEGRIVGDDHFFAHQPYPDGWTQDDLVWGYGAPISALIINDNSRLVEIRPGAHAGAPAQIALLPSLDAPRIVNRVVTVARGWTTIDMNRWPGAQRVTITGTIRADQPLDLETMAVIHPARWAAALLRSALIARGITVTGPAVSSHTASGTPTAQDAARSPDGYQLASLRSPPLWEDLQYLAKVSQNLHAEVLLRLLGRLQDGDGSIEAGEAVRAAFLRTLKIPPREVDLVDGSGLSRQDLAAPAALVRLLIAMDRGPEATLWQRLLPIAGEDGTLATRLRSVRGRVQAKTGLLDHVSALSGYAETRTGERLAFSILVNDEWRSHAQVHALMDRIVTALVASRPERSP